MKKLISIVLMLALVLSLCACGKSEAVKNVEETINSIGEVSIENEDAVKAARAAYNGLSDDEKSQVENYSLLESAESDLFAEKYLQMCNLLQYLNLNCDYVTNTVYTVWSNVDTDDVLQKLNGMILFDDAEKKLADYKDYINSTLGSDFSANDIELLLWGIAEGINPEALERKSGYYTGKFISEEAEQETIELCATYALGCNNIKDGVEYLNKAFPELKKAYGDTYSAEIEILQEWHIESEIYADFALNPSGNKTSFTNSVQEYQETMSRYAKTAETYSPQ